MACIKAYTTRKANQGLGIEYEVPYDWNYNRDIYPHSDNARSLGLSNRRWKNIYAKTFTGALSGNASTATKATQDSAGQQINTTYLKGLSVSGKTVTYTKGDGSTGIITTQDTTYGVATTSTNGLMSSTDKSKLDGIASGANKYTLPTASASTLGGVKIGEGLTINSGVCSLNMKTTKVTLDVANWTQQSDGSYTQTVAVGDITSSQSPIIDLDTNGKTLETIESYEEEWSKVVDAQSNNGSITFKAKEQINTIFSVVVKSSLGTVNDGYTSTVQEVVLSSNGWSNNAQTVTLTGMTALKYPIVDVKINTTVIADIQNVQNEFANIIHAVTGTNQITFYCSSVPTIDLTILVKEI